MNCPTCGRPASALDLAEAWCRSHENTYPSMWTSAQAAQDAHCPTNTMGAAMAKRFPKRQLKLGPDINKGNDCVLYCLYPETSYQASFLASSSAQHVRTVWRKQHEAYRQALTSAP